MIMRRLSRKMAPVLRRIYDQMPEPKWVISRAPAPGRRRVRQLRHRPGRDQVAGRCFVPGRPPRPESQIYGIVQLQKKIAESKL